ncbi:MAG: hypothetical protein AMJ81_11835 [Phycisphaerae bacterium SM23_33]|nr:MAG: hypothetical protein AMJ81_11835 [Phycisphaerae bacterium SM23_33]
MSELPELTPRQAEAAVERAGESIALTSGAGCGKTLVLARRFTTLLLAAAGDGESPFDRLVALTFTDKAALEMLSRVRDVLLDAIGKTDDPQQRRRLADWITELPAAHISTIHSFCAGLLRRHAIEAGVDPDFAVFADELVAAQMLTESAQAAVLAAVEEGQADVLELLARASLGRVVDDVIALAEKRIEWAAQDYADPDATLARWRGRQADLRGQHLAGLAGDKKLRRELDYLLGYECSDPEDKLERYRYEKLDIIRQILQHPAAVAPEQVGALTEKPGGKGRAAAWGGRGPLKQYRDRLRRFVERFAVEAIWFEPLADADAEAAGSLAALTGLAAAAADLYDQAKRAAGMLDFDDLIVLTGRLLRQDPAVRGGLRKGLTQLLLDECQDTDAHQLQMLWNLLADGDRPPPGRLFIVGDIKQSIYRFRGARAEEFTRLCGRFGDAQIALDESFRMHRAGVAFINHVFGELMADYEPMASARKELPPGPSVEVLLAECDDSPNAAAIAAAQADLTAERIAWMIGRQKLVWDRQAGDWRAVRPGDVAILFARRTWSLEYERALQQRDVPYYVVAGTGFFRQQEVYDVLNALRVIDNPFDDVALAGVLRSAMFGLDDNVLLHLAAAAEPPYFEKLTRPGVLERLAQPQRRQLQFAHDLLAGLHRAKDALGPAALIERLLAETGYAAVLLGQFNGRRMLGNVRRLLAAARSAEAAGAPMHIGVADFVKRYGEFVLAQWRYEQAAVVGEAEDVVRLMTIHKAKGLEFPVVVVPDLNAGFRGPGTPGLLFGPDWGLTCIPPQSAGENDDDGREEPISYRLAREAEKQELVEEDIRKLYVAATRHKDHLVLVGADWRGRDGQFRDGSSYLAQLDGVLGIRQALDRGAERIPYGEDFQAEVARLRPPEAARPRGRTRPPGRRILAAAAGADQLASGLAASARACELPLVGPLLGLAGETPAGAVAATALADFEHCPMLYHWRHELRAPVRPPPAGQAEGRLDAASAGSLFHRCMELLDFSAADLPAQAGSLVRRAAGEMELELDPAPIARELAGMLERFAAGPLAASVRGARRALRELAILFRAGGMEVAGQLDLLYEDAAGAWHVVDYKSDRLGPRDVPSHARRYELQMLIYLTAARRHLGDKVTDATVYFLRPGLSHRFQADRAAPASLEKRLAALAAELVGCRRTGRYRRREDGLCGGCPYAGLCLRQGTEQ